jgi:hypothetical protein
MVEAVPSRVEAAGVFGFACNACGKCCNSPPRLSLAELFRYQDIFVGCLAVVPLAAGGDPARAALFDRIAFRAVLPGAASHVAIMAQGYAYESQARCPALRDDGVCALHGSGKPAQCIAVPLDPLVPDAWQDRVMAERLGDQVWRQAGCLKAGDSATHRPLLGGGAVRDAAFAGALAARRTAMADDKALWGGAVFAALEADWRASSVALARVGPGGFLALPVSAAIHAIAPHARDRCAAFLAAQIALIETELDGALRRRNAIDRPVTHRLRAWLTEYRGILADLRAAPMAMPAAPRPFIDTWLTQARQAA